MSKPRDDLSNDSPAAAEPARFTDIESIRMPDQARHRRRKVQDDAGESDDEDDDRVLYFVPSQDIDIEVLVYYLRRYLGNDSDAEPGQHPQVSRVALFLGSWFSLTFL